jgi:hypothetical protein
MPDQPDDEELFARIDPLVNYKRQESGPDFDPRPLIEKHFNGYPGLAERYIRSRLAAADDPWILDAVRMEKRLRKLDLERLFTPPIRRVNSESSPAEVSHEDSLSQLCLNRFVKWQDTGASTSASNFILLCGPRGAGKTVTLLRTLAGRSGDGLPGPRWFLDYESNVASCEGKLNLDEAIDRIAGKLEQHSRSKSGGIDEPVLLAVDGLDSAARHISTSLQSGAGARKLASKLVIAALGRLFGRLSRYGRVTLIVSVDVEPTSNTESS